MHSPYPPYPPYPPHQPHGYAERDPALQCAPMSEGYCPTCGTLVGGATQSCAACGREMPKPVDRRRRGKIVVRLLGIYFVIAGLGAAAYGYAVMTGGDEIVRSVRNGINTRTGIRVQVILYGTVVAGLGAALLYRSTKEDGAEA